VLNFCSTCTFLMVSVHRFEVNNVPLSVMILCGSPCCIVFSFIKRLAKCSVSWPFENGMKSIVIEFLGQAGVSFDCSNL